MLIITDNGNEFASRVASLVGDGPAGLPYVVQTPADVMGALEGHGATVILFGPSVPLDDALEVVSGIDGLDDPPAVVLVSSEVTPELLRAAMRAGVRDVLSAEDQAYTEILAAISEAAEAVVARRDARVAGDAAVDAGPSRGRVVTVFSTKGGVGKSVIATNLGAALAQLGRSVILVDLDLQFGDAGIMLNLEPKRTIADAVQSFERLDEAMLRSYLVEHSSGLRVLLAPTRPEDAEVITTPRITHIISLLRGMADIVILDTPGTLDETVLTAIDSSDSVIAVATMDIASIKNTRISLQKLRQLGYENGLVRLVLNRADSKVLLEPEEVEKAIGARIRGRIPSDRVVPRSVNKGIPVVIEEPRSAVAKSLVDLARSVSQDEEATDYVA